MSYRNQDKSMIGSVKSRLIWKINLKLFTFWTFQNLFKYPKFNFVRFNIVSHLDPKLLLPTKTTPSQIEKASNEEKLRELMKRHSFSIDKKPLRANSFLPRTFSWKRAFFLLVAVRTYKVAPYFTKLVMLQLSPSEKFILYAYTFLMDSWMECNKRLSHWCCWYEILCHFQAVA